MIIRLIVDLIIIGGTFFAGGYWWIAGMLYALMLLDTGRRQHKAKDPDLDAYIANNNAWSEAFGLAAIVVILIIVFMVA